MSEPNSSHVAASVAKVFEPRTIFENRMAELMSAFERVERLGNEAIVALDSINLLASQIEELAYAFEPMRTFHEQLAVLGRTFEPMKSAQDQLAELSQAVCGHLSRLAGSLERAKKFQLQVSQLGTAFGSVTALQQRFDQLARAFEMTCGPAATANGAAPTAPADRAS